MLAILTLDVSLNTYNATKSQGRRRSLQNRTSTVDNSTSTGTTSTSCQSRVTGVGGSNDARTTRVLRSNGVARRRLIRLNSDCTRYLASGNVAISANRTQCPNKSVDPSCKSGTLSGHGLDRSRVTTAGTTSRTYRGRARCGGVISLCLDLGRGPRGISASRLTHRRGSGALTYLGGRNVISSSIATSTCSRLTAVNRSNKADFSSLVNGCTLGSGPTCSGHGTTVVRRYKTL